MKKKMTKEKLNFLSGLEKIKYLNTIDFFFVQMVTNHVNRNKCVNLIQKYNIDNTDSNLEEIEKVLAKTNYYVYLKICDLIDSARIIEVTNQWFIFEFDLAENNKLAEDLTNLFFIKRISQRRVQKKIGHGYVLRNLFVSYKIMKQF